MNYLGHFEYHGIVYSKKNSKSIVTNRYTGKPMLVSSKNASKMEKDMAEGFALQLKTRTRETTDDAVAIYMKLYRKNNTPRDLDNTATSVLDGLVKGAVLEDDNINHVKHLEITDCGVDAIDPRVEIQVSM